MRNDELVATTETLRRYVRPDRSPYEQYAAEFYIVCVLQGAARPYEGRPELDRSDAELGARVRMLLAALEAAKSTADA